MKKIQFGGCLSELWRRKIPLHNTKEVLCTSRKRTISLTRITTAYWDCCVNGRRGWIETVRTAAKWQENEPFCALKAAKCLNSSVAQFGSLTLDLLRFAYSNSARLPLAYWSVFHLRPNFSGADFRCSPITEYDFSRQTPTKVSILGATSSRLIKAVTWLISYYRLGAAFGPRTKRPPEHFAPLRHISPDWSRSVNLRRLQVPFATLSAPPFRWRHIALPWER